MNGRDDKPQSARRHIAHRLLPARDWQDRQQFNDLCDWWRSGHGGVCALVGIGGAGKTAIADRFVRSLPGVLPSPDVAVDESLTPPRGLFVFSFYDAPNPDTFFRELAAWLDDLPEGAKVSYEQTVRRLEKESGVLLVLDGPETARPPETPSLPTKDAAGMTHNFDVFLSHNSKDKPAVRKLKKRLETYKLSCWLDEDQLRPGIPWQQLLQEGIQQSASIAVLIGKDGLGPWEDEEMQAALTLAVRDKRPVIPVLLPGAPTKPDLPMFLGSRTWADLRGGFTKADVDKLVWGITGKKP